MQRTLGLIIAAGLCLAACGGGSPSSPTPPPSTATVTGVTLSALDVVKLNNPQRLTLTATMSDGTTRAVQGTWQSSDQSIAIVAVDGLVTPVASGEVDISVQHEGHRADRRLRVVPDYAGAWDGTYRVYNCTDSGDWEGVCDDEDPNDQWDLDLVFTQTNASVTGTVEALADATVQVTGEITTNGRLAASWTLEAVFDGERYVIKILEWDTLAFESNRLMNGRFVIVGSSPDFTGEYRYFCEITVMGKLAVPGRVSPGAAQRFVRTRGPRLRLNTP